MEYEDLVWEPVTSSNLAQIAYDPDNMELWITFLNGGMYSYSNVSEELYRGLLTSASKGRFFHRNIKTDPNRYPFVRHA